MSNNSTSPSSAGSQTTTSNDGTTSNSDQFTSPVTIIPLITTVMLLCSIIVAAFMIYRRRKRLQLLNELVHANKRIRVVSTDLEKAKDDQNGPKEVTKVVKSNITKTTKGNHDDTLKPPPLPPPRKISVTATTRRKNPPVMRFNPYEHPRSFKISKPIHVTTSDTTVHDNNPGYTSMEVNYNDTPSIVAFRPRTTHNQVTFAGLMHHYNKMGTSAEGLSRIHTDDRPPISPPPVPMRNIRLGYMAPENTFQDTTLDVTSASHRTIYGSEELDISVATSLAFYPNNVYKNPIDYEPVQSKYTELEHWV